MYLSIYLLLKNNKNKKTKAKNKSKKHGPHEKNNNIKKKNLA